MIQNSTLLPILNTNELILKLINKNIKFNKISKNNAKKYLININNYYNITSYKSNFEKYLNGNLKNKYLDLDFAYLVDLSEIDRELKQVLYKMVISIEHFLKMRILYFVENLKNEDGYRVVNLYLNKDYSDNKYPKKLHNEIYKKVGSIYYNKIFSKYDIDRDKKLENIPIYEFLEIITFGELVNFYEFLTNEYNLINEYNDVIIYREIVKLRNAVMHNSNILSELDVKDNYHHSDFKVIYFLINSNIDKRSRMKKLKNSRIKQITYTLYMFNKTVKDKKIRKDVIKHLNNLMYKRIILHKDYYNNNELLKSIYFYFEKIIKTYYKK